MMTKLETITNAVIDALRQRKIPVGISNRHVHLSAEDYEALFPGEPISAAKALYQPGHFAADQSVSLIGPKGTLEKVRVLGPLRRQSQIEISLTNARELGVAPVIRQSGELAETPGIILQSPYGQIELSEGVIVAKRHVHMSPLDALVYGLENNQEISVSVGSESRKLVFDQVTVRVDPNTILEMHLDTDEANAAGLSGRNDFGVLVKGK